MAGSQVRSDKVFTGTNAERIALDTTNVEPNDRFKESDTGDEYEYSGSQWKQISSGGAAHVSTQAGSVNAYGNYPETWGDNFIGAVGVNDNDVIYTSADVTYANNITIECTAGTIDIEVTEDDTNWRLATLRSMTAAGVVVSDDIELVAGEFGILKQSDVGKFLKFRINQKGATASNARGRYGVA